MLNCKFIKIILFFFVLFNGKYLPLFSKVQYYGNHDYHQNNLINIGHWKQMNEYIRDELVEKKVEGK